MTEAGWLSAMIPEEYGGSGLGLAEASVILEEVNRCGGNPDHSWADVQHVHAAQKRQRGAETLPAEAGERRAAPAVHGRHRADHRNRHHQDQDHRPAPYEKHVINGQKVWISRIQHSDLMILLARTTPLAEVQRKSEGMSIFLVDLREAIGNGLTVQPIANMVNHETNELFFDNRRSRQ